MSNVFLCFVLHNSFFRLETEWFDFSQRFLWFHINTQCSIALKNFGIYFSCFELVAVEKKNSHTLNTTYMIRYENFKWWFNSFIGIKNFFKGWTRKWLRWKPSYFGQATTLQSKLWFPHNTKISNLFISFSSIFSCSSLLTQSAANGLFLSLALRFGVLGAVSLCWALSDSAGGGPWFCSLKGLTRKRSGVLFCHW